MKKKRKLILTALTVVLCFFAGSLWAVTDYLISYALLRPEESSSSSNSSSKSRKTSATKEKVALWKEDTLMVPQEITSFDGLNLWAMSYLQESHSDLWLIGVHGYQSSYTSIEDVAMECHQRGFHVLLPDLRGHGNSEGEYIGMGFHDSWDILAWIDAIIGENPQANIALFGLSMGGATVMMTAGQESLPSNVFAVIEDCGYTDVYTMVEQQLYELYGVPAFPLLPITNFMAEFQTNYNLKDASPIEFLQSASLPMLFIHGDQDPYVLPFMQQELYHAYEGEKEILTIPQAGHVASRRTEPEIYYETFFSFLEKYQPA